MIAGSWFDQIPQEPAPARDTWLAARSWPSYEEYVNRDPAEDEPEDQM